MYCIDTEALVLMFNGGSYYGFTIHPIFRRDLISNGAGSFEIHKYEY